MSAKSTENPWFKREPGSFEPVHGTVLDQKCFRNSVTVWKDLIKYPGSLNQKYEPAPRKKDWFTSFFSRGPYLNQKPEDEMSERCSHAEWSEAEEAAFQIYLEKYYGPILTMAELEEAAERFEGGWYENPHA